jgi:hypothetical protein
VSESIISTQQGRVVAGTADNDTAFEAFFAEAGGEELLDFAAAFADQRDDADIGAGVSGDGGHERALANAGTGEDSHALAEAAGVQAVNGADAGGDGLADVVAFERADATAVDAARFAQQQRAFAVHRPAEAVEDAPEELLAAPDSRGGLDIFDPVAPRHARDGCQREQERAILLEPDDLGEAGPAAEAVDAAHGAHRQRQVGRLDRQPADALNLADHAVRHHAVHCVEL